MSIFIFFFQLFSLSTQNAMAGCTYQKSNIQQNTAAGLAIERQIQLQEFDKSPNTFCDRNMGVRFLQSRLRTGEVARVDLDKWKDKVEEFALRPELSVMTSGGSGMGMYISPPYMKGSSWGPSLIPSDTARSAIAEKIPIPEEGKTVSLDEAITLLQSPRCSFSEPPPPDVPEPKKMPHDLPFKSLAQKEACGELLGFFKMNSCTKSFETGERIGKISSNNLTGAELYSRVLNDSRYDEGLRLAALKMSERVKLRSEASGNYFEDLKSSFIAAGANNSDAEEMTWQSIGMIASGGPNLDWRMSLFPNSRDQRQKRLALQTIANVLPILDHRSAKSGHIYSLPKQISGTCNTGKSYHFWYSAFLSRRAALESGSSQGAAAMAFSAEKYYQLSNRAGSRDANKSSVALVESPIFSSASNIARADLAYAATGATFGAEQATDYRSQDLNVDRKIRDLLSSGGTGDAGFAGYVAEKIGGKLGENYSAWTKTFNGNIAFQAPRASLPIQRSYLNFEKSPKHQQCKN